MSPETSPESATSPSVRVKNWLKSRLHKPRAKSVSHTKKSEQQAAGGFVGGHALTGRHADGTGSMTSLSEVGMRSLSEVALAGRPVSDTPLRRFEGEAYGARKEDISMSSISSDEGGEAEARARVKTARPAPLDLTMTPPRALADPARLTPRSSASPNRDSKFIENIE